MKTTKNTTESGGKVGIWVKIIGIPVFLLLAFLLGFFVFGQHSLKSPIRKTIDLTRQSPVTSRPRPVIPSPETASQTEPEISLEITERVADPNASANSGVTRDADGLTIELDAPKKNQDDAQSSESTASTIESGAQPQPTDSEKPKGSQTDSGKTVKPEDNKAGSSVSKASGSFRVQTGTFADKVNADQMASELKRKGYTVYVKKVESGGRSLYRVQVGVYGSRDSASKVADKLKAGGYEPAVYAAED